MSGDWHTGMMCAFDVESTGVDVENDRIVTACVALVDGSGKEPPEVREWLAWPGMDIPEAATAIHGITTEHARQNGQPLAEVADDVATWLLRSASAGFPVIAFNAAYDLTMLDRETRRHGLEPFGPALEEAGGLVVDPWVIDKRVLVRKGSRTLASVAEWYGVKQEGAHTAAGDAVTAARVAWKIAARHPKVAQMSATELMTWQANARREQAVSLEDYFRKKGTPKPVDPSWPWKPWDWKAAA